MGTGFGYDRERRAAQGALIARLLPLVRDIRRTGAAALDLSWLAAGRLDGYFEHGLNPWDWAAGRLIAEEAGATVVELPGDPRGAGGGVHAGAGLADARGALGTAPGSGRSPIGLAGARAATSARR